MTATYRPGASTLSRIRTVPYASYLRYTKKVQELRPDVSVRFPSMFLQRYAKLYDRASGEDKPLVLEPWQVWAIDDPADQSVWVKPRQVGFSFLRAARALAKSLLQRSYTAVFISYNREEAKNKILYARALYESIRYPGKPKLVGDSMTELRFSNGSRIVSLPAKAVRGYTMPDVFADEAAFIPNAESLFSGTLSSGVRGGDGTFTAGSTPYGEANFFARLFANEGNMAPDFVRHRIEWWYSPAMCVNVTEALRHAKSMTTADRVEKYGSAKLKSIFSSLRLEDFQREHECSFSARDDSVIPRGRLLAACAWDFDNANEGCVVRHWGADVPLVGATLERDILPAIREALGYMHPTSSFVAGYDVARSSAGDPAALAIIEERRDGQRITRAFLMFHGMDWPYQEAMLKGVAADRQCRRLHIDGTQMGAKLANDVRTKFVREGTPWDEGKVVSVNFGVESQRNGVFHAVVQAVQSLDVRIYPHADLFRHFAAFKREPESGAFADKYTLLRGLNEDGSSHHAEIVVALGLALYDYPLRKPTPRSEVRARPPGAGRGAVPQKPVQGRSAPAGAYAMTAAGLWVPDGLLNAVDHTRPNGYHLEHGRTEGRSEQYAYSPDSQARHAGVSGGLSRPRPDHCPHVRGAGLSGQLPRDCGGLDACRTARRHDRFQHDGRRPPEERAAVRGRQRAGAELYGPRDRLARHQAPHEGLRGPYRPGNVLFDCGDGPGLELGRPTRPQPLARHHNDPRRPSHHAGRLDRTGRLPRPEPLRSYRHDPAHPCSPQSRPVPNPRHRRPPARLTDHLPGRRPHPPDQRPCRHARVRRDRLASCGRRERHLRQHPRSSRPAVP